MRSGVDSRRHAWARNAPNFPGEQDCTELPLSSPGTTRPFPLGPSHTPSGFLGGVDRRALPPALASAPCRRVIVLAVAAPVECRYHSLPELLRQMGRSFERKFGPTCLLRPSRPSSAVVQLARGRSASAGRFGYPPTRS